MIDLQPFRITLELALLTTGLLLVVGVPLAAVLAGSKSRMRPVWEALVGLPLVLPPTVLGFYFLLLFGPSHGIGGFLERVFDVRLVFSFPGLVVASVIYSLPFMVQPVQAGVASMSPALVEASRALGKTRVQTFLYIILPNVRPSLLTGAMLTFAHTIGEFGVVLMIGGNIPGKTRVVSIALYDEAESLNFAGANLYAGILLAVSFLILLFVYTSNRNYFLKRFS
jgi:molybdate transport system permease protein